MPNRTRAVVIAVGAALVILSSATFLPLFILTYTPGADHPLDGNNPTGISQLPLNALTLAPYLSEINYLQPLYAFVGLSLLIAVLSFFTVHKVIKFVNFIKDLSAIASWFLNIFNKSIIHHMNSTFLYQFYGTTDLNYATSHTTITPDIPALIIFCLGIAVMGLAIYTPFTPASAGSSARTALGAAAGLVGAVAVIVTCTLCATGIGTFLPNFQGLASYGSQMYQTVNANQGWQDTHMSVTTAAVGLAPALPSQFCIAYISGTWTVDQGTVLPSDAAGKPPHAPSWLAKQPGQPIPGVSSQALIGRIGNGAPFVVGNLVGVDAQHGGELYLQMNASDATLSHAAGHVYVIILDDEYDNYQQYHCPTSGFVSVD